MINLEKRKFAFLLHFRQNIKEDARRLWTPLGWKALPEKMVLGVCTHLPPMIIGQVKIDDQVVGGICLVPHIPQQLLTQRKKALATIFRAMALCYKKGYSVIGLGALTSPATLGGKLAVKQEPPYLLTNGNALTSGITVEAVNKIKRQLFPQQRVCIAVVGATGSTGSAVSALLARDMNDDLLLIGRDAKNTHVVKDNRKLFKLHSQLRANKQDTRASVNLDDLRDCDIVVVTTSAVQHIIQKKHLKPGAVVYDITQPRNTNPELRTAHDILVIDGGLLQHPAIKITRDIDLRPGQAYSCLVETMLLAQNGAQTHFSIGAPTLSQVDYIMRLYKQSRWELAPFHSFRQPVSSQIFINYYSSHIQTATRNI